MAGKWDGKKCPVCCEGTLHDGMRSESVEYRGKTFKSDQFGAYCDNCNDGVLYDDPVNEQKWEDFRAQVNAEQAAELAAIRGRLRLTQEQASKLTGGGHNAFSRYERQEAQPVMAVVNLFRLLDRHPSLIAELVPDALPRSSVAAGTLWMSISEDVHRVALKDIAVVAQSKAQAFVWARVSSGAFEVAEHWPSVAWHGAADEDVVLTNVLAVADMSRQRAPRSPATLRFSMQRRKQA